MDLVWRRKQSCFEVRVPVVALCHASQARFVTTVEEALELWFAHCASPLKQHHVAATGSFPDISRKRQGAEKNGRLIKRTKYGLSTVWPPNMARSPSRRDDNRSSRRDDRASYDREYRRRSRSRDREVRRRSRSPGDRDLTRAQRRYDDRDRDRGYTRRDRSRDRYERRDRSRERKRSRDRHDGRRHRDDDYDERESKRPRRDDSRDRKSTKAGSVKGNEVRLFPTPSKLHG